jgi:hypothetical protein
MSSVLQLGKVLGHFVPKRTIAQPGRVRRQCVAKLHRSKYPSSLAAADASSDASAT